MAGVSAPAAHSSMVKLAKFGVQPRKREHPADTHRERGRWGQAAAGAALATKRQDIGSALNGPRGPSRSDHLSLAAARNIIEAAHHASSIGRPLNRFTTLHFEAAQVSDPVRATGRLLKLAGDWLRTMGEPLCAIWVRETGEGKGEHLHLLWHVPTGLAGAFAKRERGWRTKIGMKQLRGSCHSRPVGLSYRHALRGTEYGESYTDNLANAVGYILKGVNPTTAKRLSLPRCEPQGRITSKRSGMTENLNRKARSAKQSKFADDLGKSGALTWAELGRAITLAG